jgi:hypothetical protein
MAKPAAKAIAGNARANNPGTYARFIRKSPWKKEPIGAAEWHGYK